MKYGCLFTLNSIEWIIQIDRAVNKSEVKRLVRNAAGRGIVVTRSGRELSGAGGELR